MATRIAVMNKGVLQQLNTPQYLYDHPRQYVRRPVSLVQPAMNFFPAHLRKDGNQMIVDTGDFSVTMPEHLADKVQSFVDKEVIMGIRPEDIHNPDFVPAGIHTAAVEAKVDVTELMGYEIQLYKVSGKHKYVARVDPRTRFGIGDQFSCLFNLDKYAHLRSFCGPRKPDCCFLNQPHFNQLTKKPAVPNYGTAGLHTFASNFYKQILKLSCPTTRQSSS